MWFEGLCKSFQYGLIDVIKSDFKSIFSHPHPSKPMCCYPKSLLRVPDPDRCKSCPTGPFDDLLIKTQIEVSLMMVVTGKVHVNVALTDQLFERLPDKPGYAMALGPNGAGRIMTEQKAPARFATQRGLC